MKNIKDLGSRGILLLAVLGLGVAVVAPAVLPGGTASAALLTLRKIELDSAQNGNTSTDANGVAVTAGAGGNGAETTHKFTFTHSAATVGSFAFQYCTTPFHDTACTTPTGIDVNGDDTDTNAGQTGLDGGALTYDTTTNATTTNWFATNSNACASATGRENCFLYTRTAGAELADQKEFTFGQANGWVKNPTTDGTYYVRITSFSDNAYTTVVDYGAVAFSINEDIDITARVQEKLNFSVSSTQNAAGATCAALPAGGSITMGSGIGILDTATAYDGTSYFRVSTNTASGTVVKYTGNTLRTATGGYTITANSSEVASAVGTEQFGLAIDNTATGYSNTDLPVDTGYDTGNGTITNGGTALFNFSTGSTTTPVTLAATDGSPTYVTCDTLAVRYIANISPVTEPGIYRTNIGYIAVATY